MFLAEGAPARILSLNAAGGKSVGKAEKI